MEISDTEFIEANRRGAAKRAAFPAAVGARYDRRLARIVISFASGLQLAFPPRAVEGLQTALPDDFAEAEVSPSGLGVHFPRLDADIYLPALLESFFGAGQPAGSYIGKADAKTIAASENGKIG